MIPQICNSHGFYNKWVATDYHHKVFRLIAAHAEKHLTGNIIVIDDTWLDNIDTLDKFYLKYGNVTLADVDHVLFVALVDSTVRNTENRKKVLGFINPKHWHVINESQQFSFWGYFAYHEYTDYKKIQLPWIGDKLFLSYNRKPHSHRVALYNEFKERDLLRHGVFTLGNKVGFAAADIPENIGIADAGAGGDVGIPNDVITLGNHDVWQSAFINIVTETHIGDEKFLSEKIWKPIIGKRPFLVVGPHSTLQQLQGWGFKTFDDFWDESYIKLDHEDAIKEIAVLIDELANLYPAQLEIMYRKMQAVLEHNHQHFFGNFTKRNNAQLNNILRLDGTI